VSEQFAAIAKAARVLLDEELRGIYDEEGEEGIPDQSESVGHTDISPIIFPTFPFSTVFILKLYQIN
jgi:DnaJ-class molecular chaperone